MNLPILLFLLASELGFAKPICLTIKDGLDKMCARDLDMDSTCKSRPGKDISIGWSEESCVIQKGDEIIKEILNLPDDAIIPNSVYATYSSEKIATSIVYRYFQKVERQRMTDEDVLRPGYNIYQHARPIMAFSAVNLPSIITSGFLNQHQTGTTNGSSDKALRMNTENAFVQVLLEKDYVSGKTKVNEVRPKYSYAFFDKAGSQVSNTYTHHYGATLVVFKNEIKKRATLSNNDSLNDFVGSSRFSMRRNTYYSLYTDFAFTPTSGAYYESQIWGAIPFSFVEYILTGCISDESQSVITALKAANLQTAVYSCTVDRSLGFARFLPAKLIYGAPVANIRVPVVSTIQVVQATFGGNVAGVASGNATKPAKDWCDDKTDCDYKVSLKFLADPAPGQDKDFNVTWTCSADKTRKVHKTSAPVGALEVVLKLSCAE